MLGQIVVIINPLRLNFVASVCISHAYFHVDVVHAHLKTNQIKAGRIIQVILLNNTIKKILSSTICII